MAVKLMEILLVGLTVLTLVIGFLTLWTGETEVLPRGYEGPGSLTEGAKRPAVPSRREFEAPLESPRGPFYIQ